VIFIADKEKSVLQPCLKKKNDIIENITTTCYQVLTLGNVIFLKKYDYFEFDASTIKNKVRTETYLPF